MKKKQLIKRGRGIPRGSVGLSLGCCVYPSSQRARTGSCETPAPTDAPAAARPRPRDVTVAQYILYLCSAVPSLPPGTLHPHMLCLPLSYHTRACGEGKSILAHDHLPFHPPPEYIGSIMHHLSYTNPGPLRYLAGPRLRRPRTFGASRSSCLGSMATPRIASKGQRLVCDGPSLIHSLSPVTSLL